MMIGTAVPTKVVGTSGKEMFDGTVVPTGFVRTAVLNGLLLKILRLGHPKLAVIFIYTTYTNYYKK